MATPVEMWLNEIGFVRGNPFAHVEADRERAMLPQTFVDVEGYDRVQSADTLLVFAPRGGGKSALRIMLAGTSAPIVPDAQTLCVEYTRFDPLLDKQRRNEPVLIDDHVALLLSLGGGALCDALFGSADLDAISPDPDRNRSRRAARARAISYPVRARLGTFLRSHAPELLRADRIGEWLDYLYGGLSWPDWSGFESATAQKRLLEWLGKAGLAGNESADLLAHLNDFSGDGMLATSPTEAFADLVALVRAAGFSRLHLLVDRVDESAITADNPQVQASLLEPLLAHLPVLEMPRVAFHFFLARPVRDFLWQLPAVRRDRLESWEMVEVQWTEERLKQLLDARLQGYSHKPPAAPNFMDWSQLCLTPQAGIALEQKLLTAARHSPRRLLLAAQSVCEAHVQQAVRKNRTSPGLLDTGAWEAALPLLEERLLLSASGAERLTLDFVSGTARTAQGAVVLKKKHIEILRTLVEGGGRCDREQLIAAVSGWDDYTSNEAVDKEISRLRRELGDKPQAPRWLETVRSNAGQATVWQLHNYVVLLL